jgi:hypothetical protein
MDYKKILESKYFKVAAIIVLPTALVGTYYAYKYIKDKRGQKKLQEENPEQKADGKEEVENKKMNFIQKLFK